MSLIGRIDTWELERKGERRTDHGWTLDPESDHATGLLRAWGRLGYPRGKVRHITMRAMHQDHLPIRKYFNIVVRAGLMDGEGRRRNAQVFDFLFFHQRCRCCAVFIAERQDGT